VSQGSIDAALLLEQTHLFATLDREGLRHLAARSTLRRYRRGEVIFHEQDAGDALFVVVEGLVKVYVTSAEGDEMVLVTLGTTSVFGELPLVDGGARSASAAAIEATTLLALTRSDLLESLREHPQVLEALLSSLGAMVRRLTDQAADLVFLDLPGRVAKLLVNLAAERGSVLDLQLTQADLASMVGGWRQSVNQVLQTFERLGYLTTEGRRIAIQRSDALRRRAGLPASGG
jgi:CRP/FNR family transcriptional regulator, cyclic AMP receptor protein